MLSCNLRLIINTHSSTVPVGDLEIKLHTIAGYSRLLWQGLSGLVGPAGGDHCLAILGEVSSLKSGKNRWSAHHAKREIFLHRRSDYWLVENHSPLIILLGNPQFCFRFSSNRSLFLLAKLLTLLDCLTDMFFLVWICCKRLSSVMLSCPNHSFSLAKYAYSNCEAIKSLLSLSLLLCSMESSIFCTTFLFSSYCVLPAKLDHVLFASWRPSNPLHLTARFEAITSSSATIDCCCRSNSLAHSWGFAGDQR